MFKKLKLWWKNRRVRRRWAKANTVDGHPLELTPGDPPVRMHRGKPQDEVEIQLPPLEERQHEIVDNSDYAKILMGEKL